MLQLLNAEAQFMTTKCHGRLPRETWEQHLWPYTDITDLTRWSELEQSSCKSSWSGAPAPQWREAYQSKDDFLSIPPPGLFCSAKQAERRDKNQFLYIGIQETAEIARTLSKLTLRAEIGWMCVWIPFHLCLFFLFLDHLDLTVLSLCVTIAYCTGMLGKEKRQWSYKRHIFNNTLTTKALFVAIDENIQAHNTAHLSVFVCLRTHILGECLQRLPSADPLACGTMSQRSADTKSKQVSRSIVQVRKIALVCFSVCWCVLSDLRSCRMWCWTLSIERSLAGWPSKDPLSIRCLVQALDNTNTKNVVVFCLMVSLMQI